MSSSSTVPSTPGRQPGRAAQIHMPCVVLTIVPPTRNASPPAAPKRWFIRHDLPRAIGPAIASTQSGPGKLPSHSSVSAWSSISPDAHEARRRGVEVGVVGHCADEGRRFTARTPFSTFASLPKLNAAQSDCGIMLSARRPPRPPAPRQHLRPRDRTPDGQTVFVDSRYCVYRLQDAWAHPGRRLSALGATACRRRADARRPERHRSLARFKTNGRDLARDDKLFASHDGGASGRRRRSPEGCPSASRRRATSAHC